MFRKISESIISAAVSPFSSAPSTPAATASSSTLDLASLSIASSTASTDENTHQARAEVERQLADELAKFGVPMSTEDCFGCDDHQEGCDESEGAGQVTHVQYPRGFDVDWDSDLLASAKPQPRQLVISTGRSDWPHDHTEDETTLSHHLNNALMKAAGITPAPPPKPDQGGQGKDQKAPPPPPPPIQQPTKPPGRIEIAVGKDGLPQGIYEAPATKITPSMQEDSPHGIPEQPGTMLFSSSLISQSHEGHRETVLAFPDWKVVVDVTNNQQGAEGVLTDLVSRTEGQGDSGRRTWTLPYRAVVLLCSHKRRDKRCHIAAPLLEKALCQSLEQHHVSVDLKGHSLSADHLEEVFPPLDQVPTDELPSEVERRLRAIDAVDDEQGNGEVGIFRISHLGGHRYAGVMIICFPSGATLYYGRVSPQEIPAVVKETLLGGKILSGLLRSAGNAVRPDLVAEQGEQDAGKKVKTVCQRKGKTLLTW
ncbi:hypothetical protein QFC22_005048 [Naganishia vaughanmartiniae]|uniref:Uncharacterized protein n=1 Tax=Naganishia vaughanmartiniae TaxID=1424756 RepID=A0ACC2WXL7_9TREE|nr:hypothetical protein QFC22_005048 [Naganishia vaughanmartiniae]